MKNISFAILGTGPAGRAAVDHHAWLTEQGLQYADDPVIVGGKHSAGKTIGGVFEEKEGLIGKCYECCTPAVCPPSLEELTVQPLNVDAIAEQVDYVISALPSAVAWRIEPALNKRGVHVFSNASAYRWDPVIPLIIAEVNRGALSLVEKQDTPGKRVCNPNCTAAGFTTLLSEIESYGIKIKHAVLRTRQALSGKGDSITDPSYVDMALSRKGGFVDWPLNRYSKERINEEAWKSSCEPLKILGKVETIEEVINARSKKINDEIIWIMSETRRVLKQYGHKEFLSLYFHRDVTESEVYTIPTIVEQYRLPLDVEQLPSSPRHPFIVQKKIPMHEDIQKLPTGMEILLGRLRIQYDHVDVITLSHNLRRGATWAARQNLELFLQKYVDGWEAHFAELYNKIKKNLFLG